MVGALVRAIAFLGAVNGRVMPFMVRIAAVLIVAMTVVVVVGVFFRYVLDASLAWSEEFAIVSAIWVAFLVAPYAYRTGGHVAIEMILQALPGVMPRVLRIVINLLVLWIVYRFFFEAITFVKNGNWQRANALPIQTSWLRSIVPVSMAMLFVVGIELILRDVASVFGRRDDLDLPSSEPMEPE